jgi:hypothetical protein
MTSYTMESDIENAEPADPKIGKLFDRAHNALWLFRIGFSTFNMIGILVIAIIFLIQVALTVVSFTTSYIPPLSIYANISILVVLLVATRWLILRNRAARDRSNS